MRGEVVRTIDREKRAAKPSERKKEKEREREKNLLLEKNWKNLNLAVYKRRPSICTEKAGGGEMNRPIPEASNFGLPISFLSENQPSTRQKTDLELSQRRPRNPFYLFTFFLGRRRRCVVGGGGE